MGKWMPHREDFQIREVGCPLVGAIAGWFAGRQADRNRRSSIDVEISRSVEKKKKGRICRDEHSC
jgi:hypothetical protein